jgi:hypothetical protein
MRDNGLSGLSASFPAMTERTEVPNDGALIAEQRRRAVRAIASAATDADDCSLLLDALGLRAAEGVTSVPAPRPGR